MSLTKRKLTECLHDQCGFRMREAGEVLDSVYELMKSRLKAGEEIMISGFGKLEVREKPVRTRRGDIMWTNHCFRRLCGMLTQGHA